MPLIGEEKTTLADVPDVSVVQPGKYSFNEENSAWCLMNEVTAFVFVKHCDSSISIERYFTVFFLLSLYKTTQFICQNSQMEK